VLCCGCGGGGGGGGGGGVAIVGVGDDKRSYTSTTPGAIYDKDWASV